MKPLFSTLIIAGIALALISTASGVYAKPYFSKSDIKKMGGKPDGKIVGVVQSDPNCPPEFYARATPKNNNGELLNKEEIPNNDNKGMHKFSWYYDVLKIKQTKATNEGKIRTYVVGVDIEDKQTGEVVTHYKKIEGKKPVDFGVFDMRGTGNCNQQ